MLENKSVTTEEQQCINTFCRHIIKEKSGNYPTLKRSLNGTIVYQEAAGATTNRGNKLLQKSELVTRETINSSRPLNAESVYYNGSEHKLLQRKRMKFVKTSTADDMEDSEDSDDLWGMVDVKKVLSPISSLADIAKREPVAKIFESKVLRTLALQTILMVQKEQNSVIKYTKLLEMFLGDHSRSLYERDLNLPEYDHNLTLPNEEDTNEIEEKEKEKEKENTKQEQDEGDEDPFFALPKIADSDISSQLLSNPRVQSVHIAEEVETTRQLAQIALQRNQEYIRNLQKIRNILVKADRLKERIHAWGREYVGIQEDDVIVPNALRVVKRGLISATTNRSMGGRKGEIDGDFEGESEINELNEVDDQ